MQYANRSALTRATNKMDVINENTCNMPTEVHIRMEIQDAQLL